MFTLEQHVRPHPEVVDTELDAEETVLLHLASKTYYSLNLTGTRIWQGLKQSLALPEISRRLQTEFAVDEGQANRSVLDLVNDLCEQNLALPDSRNS